MAARESRFGYRQRNWYGPEYGLSGQSAKLLGHIGVNPLQSLRQFKWSLAKGVEMELPRSWKLF